MKKEERNSNFGAKLWRVITFYFSAESGGTGTFLTLFLIIVTFTIIMSFMFRSVLIIVAPFLIVMVWLMYKFSDRFFSLAEKKGTQKLFFPPDQRMSALRLEYKYGSDKKPLAEIKPRTKFTQPVFEEGQIIKKKNNK